MTASRVMLPGFTRVEKADTPTHEVEIGVLVEGGHSFVLNMLRNKNFPNLAFMIAKASAPSGKKLWDFKSEGFDGYGLLAKVGEETVIALLGKGKEGKVERVIPLTDLVSNKKSDLRRMIALKVAAGTFLSRQVLLTSTEELVRKADAKRAAELEEARRQAEIEAREAARKERIAKIMVRQVLTGFTHDNRRRQGIPVVDGEWQSLGHGTRVILVERIGENGTTSGMLESFQVVKERGKNPQKGFSVPVTALPAAALMTKPITRPTTSVVVELGDEVHEVHLYDSVAAIREARKSGLNGGTYVGVRTSDNRVEVHQVFTDKMQTIGHFTPLG